MADAVSVSRARRNGMPREMLFLLVYSLISRQSLWLERVAVKEELLILIMESQLPPLLLNPGHS